MPSLAARALNAALRTMVKRRLRKSLSLRTVRDAGAMLERWLSRGSLGKPGDPVTANGVACEWFAAPVDDEQRVLLYLHGGGFITHLPTAYREFARRLGAALKARVLLPDYRLAPEHPFPAGSDDCLEAYRWLLAQDVDPKRIVIAGDSAGGNLALVTAVRIRDAKLPPPACVVMLSPTTDLSGTSASLKYNQDHDPMLVPEVLEFVCTSYAPTRDLCHPWISPIYDGLQHLPPLLFHAGSTELLVDDSIRAADKARWAGVPVQIEIWPDMPHVFQMMSVLPEARAAIAQIAQFATRYVPAHIVATANAAPAVSVVAA
jgi:monoterpene epsilon-lactone hydrolase